MLRVATLWRLCDNVDPGDIAEFTLTIMEGAMMRSRAAGSLEPLDRSFAQLRIHLDRLRPTGRARRSGS